MKNKLSLTAVVACMLCALISKGATIPDPLPDPDDTAPAKDKPVKVYILSGQSNMVGMGDVSGAGVRMGLDGGSEAHISHYEENLVRLINVWRKEFKAPDAPWAKDTVGFGGSEMAEKYVRILQAQMAVADPEKHPEFAGRVKTVDIRDLWRKVEESPRSQDYHYNRNAETYYLVGERLGRAMVELESGGAETAE